MEIQTQTLKSESKTGTFERFTSLDVFRGITIALMIIVNSPGKGAALYPYLVHAKWFGFTLADLVFPSFMFAMGNSISFSMTKANQLNDTQYFQKVLKRTLLIFLFGYLMYWFPFFREVNGEWLFKPIGETRIMGVLQRIAIAYLVVSVLARYVSENGQLILCVILLLLYWDLLFLFGNTGAEFTIEGNAIKRLDLFLLGEGHIYKRDAIPFDPEGILSTLPSIVNVIAGYLVANFIQRNGKTYECLSRVMVTALLLITLALWWSLIFPLSKKLWTSPFVLYTVGLDMLVISTLIHFIEMKKFGFGISFFIKFGKNPLFIYLLSELAFTVLALVNLPSGQSVFEWISIDIFQRITPGPFGALLTGVWFMLMCWLVAWWLDRRKIYIRL